jgi:hypothetical protein
VRWNGLRARAIVFPGENLDKVHPERLAFMRGRHQISAPLFRASGHKTGCKVSEIRHSWPAACGVAVSMPTKQLTTLGKNT